MDNSLPLTNVSYPPSLIVPLRDLLDSFLTNVERERDFMLDAQDIQEILAQIFQVLLNGGPDLARQFCNLPEFNRMVCIGTIDPYDRAKLKHATESLARHIYYRVSEIKTPHYDGFPYVFSRMIGDDVLLDHIPY